MQWTLTAEGLVEYAEKSGNAVYIKGDDAK